MSKEFYYWFYAIMGITDAAISITGISWLLFFNPRLQTHHLNVFGYLFLAAFMGGLALSGYVLSRRNEGTLW